MDVETYPDALELAPALAGALGSLTWRRMALEHPPRILLLYGSLRERSYSRFLVQEAALLLRGMGAETRIFDPEGLPYPDGAPPSHPKVAELRECALWSEGQIWCSPERHGAMAAVFKAQLDWLPLDVGGLKPCQGKPVALCQINSSQQSFNTVNQLRLLARWMRMMAIPTQISVPKVYEQFDANGRMHASLQYDRLVDVVEELLKYTLLTREHADYLVDRYSERKAAAGPQKTGAL